MTIGLTMLARNSAAYMAQALEPFAGRVDEIAIVLGGVSTDNTPEIARRYADVVAEYDGPIDEDGGLLDFAHARNQAAGLLSTDWLISVDTDDVWQNVENLPEVISDAQDYHGVMFLYDLGLSRLIQPRLYRRVYGCWVSPVHEFWQYNLPADDVRVLTTNTLTIRQDQSNDKKLAGIQRNIRLAENALKNGFNFRLLFHIAREYMLLGDFERGMAACDRILKNLDRATEREKAPDKLFHLHYMRGMGYLHLGQYERAAGATLMALHYARFGDGWSLLAQIAYNLGLSDLTLEAADLALRYGQPTGGIPSPIRNTTAAPYHLKALTLTDLNRPQEALAAAELGLKLGGDDDLKRLKYKLCEQLEVIP